MASEENKGIDTIKKFVSLEANENLVNVFKAVISNFPVGSGIASLMSDFIPSKRLLRLEEFSKNVADDLEYFKESIKEEIITTEEFAYVFEECFRGASQNYQKEKLGAFRAILVNSAQTSSIPNDEKEYFINLVNTFTPLHLRILKFMAMPEVYLDENNIPTSNIQGGFSSFFPVALPGVDIEIIKMAFNDLYQNGFINTDKSIFTTMTSGQGLQLLGNRVSVIGNKFINFCSLEK